MKTYQVDTQTIELFVKCMLMTFSQNDEKLNGEVSMRSAKMKVAFDGTLLKGKAHGEGIFTLLKEKDCITSKRESYMYYGEFKDGKPDGKGKMYLLSGDEYDGQFKNGLPHGEGVYSWLFGTETHYFRGAYKDGHIQDGEAELETGDMLYKGSFKNAKFHGKGILSLTVDRKEKKKSIYEGHWENNHLVYAKAKYYSDGKCDIYEGGFTSGVRFDKRHGKGSYNFANGDYCVCEFVNGVQMGYADMNYANGKHYKGEMKNFEREGYGTLSKKGCVQTGLWKNDRIVKGKMTLTNGDVFEGEFKNGKVHGKGKFSCSRGFKYVGDWKDGEQHGTGIMTYADGDVYEGGWEDNQKHGHGIYTWQDGRVYEGEWKDDCRHGKGKWTQEFGDHYEGQYRNDQKHGTGKHTFANGDVYHGQYKKGKYHGNGKYTWVDGTVYDGEYKDGKFDGNGKYTGVDGRVYEGQYMNNMKHGRGKFNWGDGDMYEGNWRDDRMHGYGKFTHANGTIYEGEWRNGKRHGKAKVKYFNGDVFEGSFRHGSRLGHGVLTFQDSKAHEFKYKNVKEPVVKLERNFIAGACWNMNGPVILHLSNGERKHGKLKGGLFFINGEPEQEHKIEEEQKDTTAEKMLKLQAEWAARSAKRQEIAEKGIMDGVQNALDEKLKLLMASAECRRCRDLKKCTSKNCKTRKFRETFYKSDTHHCQKSEVKEESAGKESVEDAEKDDGCKENVAAANAVNAFTFGLW